MNPDPEVPDEADICTTLGEMYSTMDESVGILTGLGVEVATGAGILPEVRGTGDTNEPGGVCNIGAGVGVALSTRVATAVAVISATTVARTFVTEVGSA